MVTLVDLLKTVLHIGYLFTYFTVNPIYKSLKCIRTACKELNLNCAIDKQQFMSMQ